MAHLHPVLLFLFIFTRPLSGGWIQISDRTNLIALIVKTRLESELLASLNHCCYCRPKRGRSECRCLISKLDANMAEVWEIKKGNPFSAVRNRIAWLQIITLYINTTVLWVMQWAQDSLNDMIAGCFFLSKYSCEIIHWQQHQNINN